MTTTTPVISIVIPTHNRCKTLERLLICIGQQNYPLNLIEAIVVADGCSDGTVEMIKQFRAPDHLRYIEQDGRGAAVARNSGAAVATGTLLLFLDDDIEPSAGLVRAHVHAHQKSNRMVIGYLPFKLQKNAGFFHLKLWAWWEEKYQQMRNPGYLYSYEDLLSGNFSLPLEVFEKVKGFDCTFQFREDYELGIRLLKSNVDFIFSVEAWGYHCDEVTDITRSFKRKRQEARADIQFGLVHPDLITRLRFAYMKPSRALSKKLMFFFAFNAPKISDYIANSMLQLLNLYEWLRLRSKWDKLNFDLHRYWYLRGVVDELHTRKSLTRYVQQNLLHTPHQEEIEVDLKNGILEAEQQLDQKRPTSVKIIYGNELVGHIPERAGVERLRGAHLRPLLATKLSWPLMQALTLDKVAEGSNSYSGSTTTKELRA
jgi:glycosyltransferase involved in cell wall biosynthesis